MNATKKLLRVAIGLMFGVAAAAPLSAAFGQTAPAGTSAAGVDTIETIVVTARRRSENLQDVPLAVTAVRADTLEERDVTSLADLNSFVPNMKIATDRATSSTINVYIRGVGQSDPLWGFEPGVGVYIDDVYMARPQAALLDVLDVDRLEVLRGPQGTLYGKNTIAGAIKYVTRDIVGDASVTASVTGGNYGEHDEKLSASTPVISDHLYFGIAVADLHHDGYGHVVAQPGEPPSQSLGQDVSNRDVLAGRANLTALWGESSKLKIVFDTTQDDSNAAGGQRLAPYTMPDGTVAPVLDSRYDSRTNMPVDQDRYYRNGIAGTYTQGLGSGFDLKLVGAYREGHGRQFIDFAELDANLFQVPAKYNERQGSGEGQLTFTNDLVKAVGGVFYMDSTACGAYDGSLGMFSAPPPAGLGIYETLLDNGCVNTKSTAVYADTAWKLTDRFNLDAGVRWNQDKKEASVYQAAFISLPPTQLLPGQAFFDPTQAPAGFFPPTVLSNYANGRTFSNVSPRVGFDFHLTDHVMTYLSYSRGFKSGGFDMRGNAAVYPQTEAGYNSETADNYEVGIKSMLFDNTLQLNATLFYNPYKDAQIGVAQYVGSPPTEVTAVLNAGKQINQGVEIESVWRPIRQFTLGLNVGYLDSYYQDFIVGCTALIPGCTANSTVNIADQNRPINAPTWTVSGNSSYAWDLASGSLLARVSYDWRSFTKVANTTPSATDQPAYGVLDAGIAFTTSSKAWRFSVDGKNLTDRWYRIAGYDSVSAGLPVNLIGFYGPPRTYSATVSYHF